MIEQQITDAPAVLMSKQVAREMTLVEIDQVSGGQTTGPTLPTNVTGTNCLPSITYDCSDGGAD